MKKNLVTPSELFKAKKVFDYYQVDGKYYESVEHDGKEMLREIPKTRVDKHMKKANELAKKLKDGVDREKILQEIFMTRYSEKELNKLYQTAFNKKRKYKPKTRAGCCVDMKLGNHVIPLANC